MSTSLHRWLTALHRRTSSLATVVSRNDRLVAQVDGIDELIVLGAIDSGPVGTRTKISCSDVQRVCGRSLERSR
jgi:hypothetical protein